MACEANKKFKNKYKYLAFKIQLFKYILLELGTTYFILYLKMKINLKNVIYINFETL